MSGKTPQQAHGRNLIHLSKLNLLDTLQCINTVFYFLWTCGSECFSAPLTLSWSVCACTVESVVADEAVTQLQRHKTPTDFHPAAGDVLDVDSRTS